MNGLRNILDRLGVYNTQSPQLAAELGAYEKGLELIFGGIDEAVAEAFIQTASHEGLNARELLFRPVNSALGDEEKRALLIERDTERACFAPEAEKRLTAAGIRGTLIEHHQGGIAINVDSLMGVIPEEAQREAEALMPAHLPVYLELTGERWNGIDEKSLTFDSADALDRSWDEAEV